jgi:hypothetical protein
MHRTQIYLDSELHGQLKRRARSSGVSMSELIRQTLEKGIEKDPAADARAFFEHLEPLQSFAQVDAKSHVETLRRRSRILRKADQ